MTDPQPKKSPREVWAATSPSDRRKAIIAFAVLAVIVVAYGIYAVGFNSSSGSDDSTTPSGLDKAGCMALFNARVGHDTSDNAFWQGLVECANKGLLPPGQNNPGYYSN